MTGSGRLTLLLVLCAAAPMRAAVDVRAMAGMVVVDQGRKKPLDTYARTTLRALSGRGTIEGRSALAWLAEVLFDREAAVRRPVFLIDDPEMADALGIERIGRRRSFHDLEPGIAALASRAEEVQRTAPAARTRFETGLLRLYDNVLEYAKLASGLGYLDPNPALPVSDRPARAELGLSGPYPASYWELLQRSGALAARTRRLQQDKAARWDATDSAMAELALGMYRLQSSTGNPPPHIIAGRTGEREQWYSPWGYVAARGTAALGSTELASLASMRHAYRIGDQVAFDSAAAVFVTAVGGTEGVDVPGTGLELWYNRLDPVGWGRNAFGLALVLALAGLLGTARVARRAALALAALGLGLLSAGLAMRAGILLRPPVTNLYETFVFVAWACGALGLTLEWWRRDGTGLLVASAAGFAFAHAAGRFAPDGDTMGTLSAVLNSAFWLSSHITTISLGYAGCAAAAGLAHVYLVKRYAGGSADACAGLDRAVCGMLLFGLAFTAIGTVLGGLWAEQAWGRFWGWDPKENGALLVILWCAAMVHARRGGLVGADGTALASVILFALVMCAWLGVNLLGVGLHAYGFTTRGVRLLAAVAGAELLFAAVTGGVLLARARVNRRTQP